MKICIVTLYKSLNCGSYWQAYALGEFLKRHNNEVSYLKINYTLPSTIKPYLVIFKRLFTGGFKEFKSYFNILKSFSQKQKLFNVKTYKEVKNEAELIVLGSDTIWNIDSANLLALKDIFWGGKFNGIKTISYAASVANTSFDKINTYNDLKQDLNGLEYISVRDNYTYDIISKITNKSVELVCDPTLLLDREDYKQFVGNRIVKDKYIYIYLFDNLSQKQVDNIKEYAKHNDLKIVSGTKNFSWCDQYVLNEPDSFLNAMYYADYVVTDTFHGAVFSVNLNKQFVTIDRGKKKVQDFLECVDFTDRILNNNDIFFLFDKRIDYSNFSLNHIRENSINYLKKTLEK